jgi:hypothetical protein
MMTDDEEEKLLRSDAPQNASSILVARQRAEQRREFYLAEAQRLAHMGSWALHPSGFFEYWSPELFQIHGLDPDQGTPTLDEYLVSIRPQDRLSMARTMKANAEDSKGGKWSVYGEWSRGVRKYSRVGEGVSVGSEWLSRDLGLKRPNPCESGCYQLSGAL